MFTKSALLMSATIISGLGVGLAHAEPDRYPSAWRTWAKPTTPLTKIGALPGCEADVTKLPPIYQETVSTYCAVKVGGPGKVSILVNPSSMAVYKTRSGEFPSGPQMILHLEDLKVLFVTNYEGGKPVYEVFSEEGKKLTAKDGPLSAKACANCHTGFKAFCINGQCGSAR